MKEIALQHIDDTLASRFDSLYHWLNSKYGLKEITYTFDDKSYRVFKIKDFELALEEAIRDPGNPNNRSPYWTEFWPSAKALSAFLMRQNLDLHGKNVIELGCGLGFTGCSLGQQGGTITLSDREPDALKLAELNWIVNNGHLAPSIRQLDWNHLYGWPPKPDEQYDCIIAADVAYEIEIFPVLVHALSCLLKERGEVWLSEPNRPIAKGFFMQLESKGFTVEKQEGMEEFPKVSIYKFTK